MSHRKFSAPRSGNLGFLPRKRSRRHRGKVKSFPPDSKTGECKLTAFIGYKCGMTHTMRELNRPGSKSHQKDIVEGVTIIECPPMIGIGVVGYMKTPNGMRAVTTVWANNLSDQVRRRFYKCWYRSKKKAFKRHMEASKQAEADGENKVRAERLKLIEDHCDTVRLIASTQMDKLPLRQRKSHVMEVQINGGSVAEKVKFALSKFEQEIKINEVFVQDEVIDTIGVTKGRGNEGVITRWGVTRLPRKTHRGLRKVACIGAWHPSRVSYSVARVGQNGYHHRTELHKKIYLMGKASTDEKGKPVFNAMTEADPTEKVITPLGGVPRYGTIKNDFLIIKGSTPGCKKRPITLRKILHTQTNSMAKEEVSLKFIDTASKFGHGRFQTKQDKHKWFGATKKNPGVGGKKK